MANNSFEDMPDEELIVDAKELHESIYTINCFGTHDLLRLELTFRELEKRGYAIKEIKTLKIKKKGKKP